MYIMNCLDDIRYAEILHIMQVCDERNLIDSKISIPVNAELCSLAVDESVILESMLIEKMYGNNFTIAVSTSQGKLDIQYDSYLFTSWDTRGEEVSADQTDIRIGKYHYSVRALLAVLFGVIKSAIFVLETPVDKINNITFAWDL